MAKPLSWTRPSKRSWKSILSPISPYLSSSQGSERAWPSVNFSLSSFCISSSLKVTPGTKCGLLSCPVVTTGLRLQPWTKWKKTAGFKHDSSVYDVSQVTVLVGRWWFWVTCIQSVAPGSFLRLEYLSSSNGSHQSSCHSLAAPALKIWVWKGEMMANVGQDAP
jgi:hypothetical protein